MRVLSICWLASLTLAVMPAAAQTAVAPFTDWDEGEWHVYRTDNNDCWMVKRSSDRSHLSISVARSDRNFHVSVAKPAWTSVGVGGPYRVQVRFGTVGRTFTGRRIHGFEPPTVSMLAETSPTDLPALLMANDIKITLHNGELFESTLDPAALRNFGACAISVGGVGSAPEIRGGPSLRLRP